uniref:Dynein regulatory complex protein 1/2 N-terminal domain-containing protein n=1 Tax=Timema cristinae TaxID=61476 RepID=A0A7R9CBR6_TIMCR|nr:unnamed protein product [Timema cristinae]
MSSKPECLNEVEARASELIETMCSQLRRRNKRAALRTHTKRKESRKRDPLMFRLGVDEADVCYLEVDKAEECYLMVDEADGYWSAVDEADVTNVRIANDAREVKRREENVVAHQERMAKLDQELVASAQKLEEINARWEGILGTNDPLDLYHDIHHQRVKCSELMSQKDQLIQELRKELHLADDRFMRDQRRQKQDLGLLCERIDQQVVVMGRAYKQELLLVEKWEGLYKARDKLELSHMDKKMHTVQQFEQEMYKIHKENEEHYRAKKLQLETDLQL